MFKKNPLVAISLRNGVIGGVLGMIFFVTLYFIGRHPFMIPVFMDFRIVLLGVLILFTLKEFRDYCQQGILHFWQGMVMSLIFTTVFAVIGTLVIWVYTSWKPDFVSSYISLKLDQAKSLPAETIERIGRSNYDHIVKALPGTRGLDLALVYFWTSYVISFFLSIIISVILRRQPKP